jgi:hypothetical protein
MTVLIGEPRLNSVVDGFLDLTHFFAGFPREDSLRQLIGYVVAIPSGEMILLAGFFAKRWSGASPEGVQGRPGRVSGWLVEFCSEPVPTVARQASSSPPRISESRHCSSTFKSGRLRNTSRLT